MLAEFRMWKRLPSGNPAAHCQPAVDNRRNVRWRCHLAQKEMLDYEHHYGITEKIKD